MSKILIVEDDKGISDYIILELKHEGFETVLAESGRQALECFDEENPDLILLDLMIPEINGIEVLRRIRKTSTVPIIVETARGDTIDKINALNEGADDYIVKPYEIEELLARINALLRRASYGSSKDSVIKYKNLELNLQSMGIKVEGQDLKLSKTEYFLLKYFMENPGKVLSRSDLIDAIWGKDYYIDENTIDVYVGYLRSKFSAISKEEFIKTVRGSGYILCKR